MPDLRRFRTRAGEVYAAHKGAIDQLCAARQQLHPGPYPQEQFMAAMREALAWHILRQPEVVRICWEQECSPASLRRFEDLERIPGWKVEQHSPALQLRDLRRWQKVMENCLCDQGWAARRRHRAQTVESGRCQQGRWHLPRVVRAHQGRLFTPLFQSQSLLWIPFEGENWLAHCDCGRTSAAGETTWSSQFFNKKFFS